MSKELEEAKAFLLKSDINGVSLHDHLSETLLKILQERPKDALENFETISADVKTQSFKPASISKPAAYDMGPLVAKLETSNKLFYKGPVEEPGEGEDEMTMPNLMEERSWLQWAGMGLSESQTYRLYKSISAEMKTRRLASTRFFGKVLTRGADDYFVFEATYQEGFPEPPEDAPEPPEPDPAHEAPGTGCNENKYFVATDAAGPWTELPDVKPEHIVSARQIKKYLTGDLDAAVASYPPFPGAERDYLRAMIALISSNTLLCPVDAVAVDEEDETEPEIGPKKLVVKNLEEMIERGPIAEAEELVNPDNWVHRGTAILKIGRCSNIPKPEEEEEEEGEGGEEEEPMEEIPEQLAALSADEPLIQYPEEDEKHGEDDKVEAWSIKALNGVGPAGPYMLGCATSNRWPGAVSIMTGKGQFPKYVNYYHGYGHECTGKPFTPQPPPPIEMEAEDMVEQDDPTLEDENAQLKAQIDADLQAGDEEEEEDE